MLNISEFETKHGTVTVKPKTTYEADSNSYQVCLNDEVVGELFETWTDISDWGITAFRVEFIRGEDVEDSFHGLDHMQLEDMCELGLMDYFEIWY